MLSASLDYKNKSDDTATKPRAKAQTLASVLYQYSTASMRYLLLGDVYQLWKNSQQFITGELYERARLSNIGFGHIGPYWQNCMPKLVMVTGNSRNILQITQYGEKHEQLDPAARKPFDIIAKAAGANTIINLQGAAAQHERSKIKSYLIGDALNDTLRVSKELFVAIIEDWDKRLSFQHQITHYAVNVIGKCVFGIPSVDKNDVPIIRQTADMLAENKAHDDLFNKTKIEIKAFGDRLMTKYAHELLSTKNYIRDQLHCNGKESDEELLQKLKDKPGGFGLIVESNLSAILFVGIYYVQYCDHIKNRLCDEIKEHKEITLKTLRNLPYLNCVFNETLRFLSPTPLIVRQTSRQTTLEIINDKGKQHYIIPKHSVLFAPIRRIHHDSRYWQNPQQFDPSRFENLTEDQRYAHTKHFLPFSTGIRACPARTGFVETVFKTAIIESLKYTFKFDKEVEDIPAESIHPRWKEEYYATVAKTQQANIDANTTSPVSLPIDYHTPINRL